MRRSYALSLLLPCILLAFGIVGCAGKSVRLNEVSGNELDGAPGWVTKGRAGVEGGDKSKNLYGVGTVAGTDNVGLAREAALGRARTDLARQLQTRVSAMLKDYQSTTTGGQEFGTSANDEQYIADVSKQLTDMTLSGTELADTWVSKNGNIWALCKLDVDSFKSSVTKMNQLSESVRKAVVERADKAFEELDKETH